MNINMGASKNHVKLEIIWLFLLKCYNELRNKRNFGRVKMAESGG